MDFRLIAASCTLLAATLASAEQPGPLDALMEKGWTVTDPGPPLRMEWHGPEAGDVIHALIEPPQASTMSPKQMVRQRQAGLGTLSNCTASADSNSTMALTVCDVAAPGSPQIIGLIVTKPAPGTARWVTLTAPVTPASRERLMADLPTFLALIRTSRPLLRSAPGRG